MKKVFFSATLLSCMKIAFAGGFQLNLQGIQQLAMGGSGTAFPWDAATIFYNPGALSRLDGIQAYGSMLAVMPDIKYVQLPTGGYSSETVRQVFTPFNLYAGGPLVKGGRISIGLGVYTPFGSGTKWEDNWEGRYLIREIALQSIFFQPTVSYRINDRFSLGLGIIYATGNMKLRQALPVEDYAGRNGEAVLNGSAGGWGFNAGLSVKATEKLSFGLTYRSGVNLKLKNGNADFSVPSSLAAAFPDTKFKATFPLPKVLSLGVAYQATGKLALQADLGYTGWKIYDTLKFDYVRNTAELEDTHLPRQYHNTLAIRAGAHYQFTHKIAGMIGGAYDPTPVSDGFVSPDLPDANRLTGTLGLTYAPLQSLKIMLAAEFLTSSKRRATYLPGNFSGTYQSKAFSGGLGIVYQF